VSDVERDDLAPDSSYAQLVATRTYYPELQTWVCTAHRYSEKAHMQIRCPMCLQLMTRVEPS
jgi:hypothetical protein